jgi:hypothetical protein
MGEIAMNIPSDMSDHIGDIPIAIQQPIPSVSQRVPRIGAVWTTLPPAVEEQMPVNRAVEGVADPGNRIFKGQLHVDNQSLD